VRRAPQAERLTLAVENVRGGVLIGGCGWKRRLVLCEGEMPHGSTSSPEPGGAAKQDWDGNSVGIGVRVRFWGWLE
jgi:hypothetical protein